MNKQKIMIIAFAVILIGVVAYGFMDKKDVLDRYPNELVRTLEEKIYKNKDDLDSLFELALEYNRIGEYKKAEELYLKLMDLRPNEILYRKNLAKLYIREARYSEAVSILNDVLVLNDKDMETYHVLVDLYSVREDVRSYLDLKKYIPMLLNIEANYITITEYQGSISTLAWAYSLIGDKEKAIDYYNKKIRENIGSKEANQDEIKKLQGK